MGIYDILVIFDSVKIQVNKIMNKSENTMLIWVLSCAGFILFVLYSPLGSPDLYQQKKYFSETRGVNFSKIGITRGTKDVSSLKRNVTSLKSNVSSLKSVKNAPKRHLMSEQQNADLKIPVDSISHKNNYNYQPTSEVKLLSENHTYKVETQSDHGVSTSTSNLGSKSQENYSSNGSGGVQTAEYAVSGISNGSKNNNSNRNNSISQNPGVTSTSVDLSIFNDSTLLASNNNMQKSSNGLYDPGTDPFGDPIPVPDGLSLLFLLLIIYSGYIGIKSKLIGIHTLKEF